MVLRICGRQCLGPPITCISIATIDILFLFNYQKISAIILVCEDSKFYFSDKGAVHSVCRFL